MNNHENLQLRNPEVTPTSEILEQTLGGSISRRHREGLGKREIFTGFMFLKGPLVSQFGSRRKAVRKSYVPM